LPAGNQEALLALARRATLTMPEVSGVIDLLQGASAEQAAFVLQKPREALALVHGVPACAASAASNVSSRTPASAKHSL
jgi:hypothetical protein